MFYSYAGFKGWETCFRSIMEKSDTFRIIFQGASNTFDEEGLNAGKRVFLTMPSLTITPYAGMENSIEATGELNTAAREAFQTFMAPAFQGETPDLWSFQFLQGETVMLRVEDFTVALLFLEESEVEELLAQGVDGAELEEIENFSIGVREPGIEVVGWDKDELSSLGGLLKTAFSADHENVSTPPADRDH